ncbi:MAG: hypothetical protein LKF69_04295 [Bacilli bacterium]|jgi:hypothetical protein|nr:hypothetical protein [Bacilli bacterium]MCH4235999.1 hypothetical protein [Bacilli bacterium]
MKEDQKLGMKEDQKLGMKEDQKLGMKEDQMMYNSLKGLFNEANKIFLQENLNLLLQDVSERSLCGALQCNIHEMLRGTQFRNYYVDVEYNRNIGGKSKTFVKTIQGPQMEIIPIQCDLIVHSRGNNVSQDNLLALEMKKSSRPQKEKENDKIRLMCLTKNTYNPDVWTYDGTTFPEHVCGYVIGVYYEINRKKRQIKLEYYAEGKFKESETLTF